MGERKEEILRAYLSRSSCLRRSDPLPRIRGFSSVARHLAPDPPRAASLGLGAAEHLLRRTLRWFERIRRSGLPALTFFRKAFEIAGLDALEDMRRHGNDRKITLAELSEKLLALPFQTHNGEVRTVDTAWGNALTEFFGFDYRQTTLQRFLAENTKPLRSKKRVKKNRVTMLGLFEEIDAGLAVQSCFRQRPSGASGKGPRVEGGRGLDQIMTFSRAGLLDLSTCPARLVGWSHSSPARLAHDAPSLSGWIQETPAGRTIALRQNDKAPKINALGARKPARQTLSFVLEPATTCVDALSSAHRTPILIPSFPDKPQPRLNPCPKKLHKP